MLLIAFMYSHSFMYCVISYVLSAVNKVHDDDDDDDDATGT